MKKYLRTILVLLGMLLIIQKTHSAKAPKNHKVLKRQLKRVYVSCDVGRGVYERLLRNMEMALGEASDSEFSDESIAKAVIEGLPYQDICRWFCEQDQTALYEDIRKFLVECASKKLKLKKVKRFVFLWLRDNLPAKQEYWDAAIEEGLLEGVETLSISNRFQILCLSDDEA